MILKRTLIALGTAALAGYAASGFSLDTDIYLEPPSVSRNDAPNVLIILGNSSRAAGTYISTPAVYSAATTYTYEGAGTTFVSDRIYWIQGAQTTPSSATTYANQYFEKANNKCYSAGLPWYNNVTTPLTGKTATIGGAISAGGTADWSTISSTDTRTAVLECNEDDNTGNAATEANASYKYLKKNTHIYVSSSPRYTGGFTTITVYTGNYLNYLTNTTTTSATQLSVAQGVAKDIIDSNPGVNFGLMLFNSNSTTPHGGYVAKAIGSTATSIKTAIDAIAPRPYPNSIPADGWKTTDVCNPANAPVPTACDDATLTTIGRPLAETFYEAKLYLAGELPRYGYPTPSPTPAADTGAKDADGTYKTPFLYTCQQAYIILITGGNPWMSGSDDTDADTLISSLSSIGSFNAAYTYGNSSKMDELARWMYNNDLISNTDLANSQRVITYTVGFSLSSDSSTSDGQKDIDGSQLLQDTANNGHGRYYTATNSPTLTSALQAALVEIQTTNSSFAAPALSVNAFNKLFNRDEVYFALFKPSNTQFWDGNVKKFKLCADTTNATCTFGEVVDKDGTPAIDSVTQRIKDTSTSYWTTSADGGTVALGGAGSQIPAPASRKVYTYLGSYSGLSSTSPATLVRIGNTTGNTIYDTAINNPTILGIADTSGSSASTNATDTTNVTNLLNWILGTDSYDSDADSLITDTRWVHSDPLHSRPVAITYGGTSADPIIKLFYSSNDGAVRMVNDYNGQEEWAFIPSELLSSIEYTTSQDAVGDHLYGVDGTATFLITDADNDGKIEPPDDKVYMYIGMRRGGKNIYAFDVTPSATLTDRSSVTGITPKLMWVIRGGVDSSYLKLAQTWSKPAVARIRYGCSGADCDTDDNSAETVLIFGGGYDPLEDDVMPVQAAVTATSKIGNAIYIVDPLTGARLWWASDGNDSAGNTPTKTLSAMKFSIASDLALMDSNHDGEIDRIYVGDTGGQLWRIDLGSTLKSNSNGNTTGFVFADVGCTPSASTPSPTRSNCTGINDYDRRKFFYPPDVTQVNDNQYEDIAEAKYDLVAITSGDREDPVDLLTAGSTPVKNRIYAFRDYKIDSYAVASPSLPSSPLKDSNLYDATSNVLQDAANAGYTAALTSIKAGKGWYIDLKESGSAPNGAPATWPWVGEKGLAKPVIFDGVLFATTYTPANDVNATLTCSSSEGLAKIYGLNYLNATAAVDFNADGTISTSERSYNLGGGIPSETVIVIREGGVTSLVGTSGGAARPNINSQLPRFKTFWYEE
ncbi:MAG: hypothetical protein HY308_18435 [Gammaproteobacteria bacterium]|nr:hypothetical protein [Gammaproteobacteria bacterium]